MSLILLAIAALLLYFQSPALYSQSFCIACFAIFVVDFVIIYRKRLQKSLVRFEFFFMLAFLCTNFLYPVLVYKILPYFSLFNYSFPENYINKGCALSAIAFHFFTIGIIKRKQVNEGNDNNFISYNILKLHSPTALTCVLIVFFIPYLYSLHHLGIYTTEFESSLLNAILVYMIYFGLIAIFWNHQGNFKSLCSKNIVFFSLVALYVTLFILIGSRTIPLRILLLLLILFEMLFFKIPKLWCLIGMAVGLLGLAAVTYMRGDGDAITDEVPWLKVVYDLIINNRSLYVLMEYGDNHDINFGSTMLMNILSVVPFLQGIFLKITGWTVGDISSGNLVTDLYYTDHDIIDRIVGLGTNIIGDVYVSYGLIGVMVFFYFGGRLIANLSRKMENGSFVALLLYALIFMDSIYITRSAFFTPMRSLAWCYALYYIFNSNIITLLSNKS